MRVLLRVAVVVSLGLAVSGCDKCGHWFWETADGTPLTCKGGSGPSGY